MGLSFVSRRALTVGAVVMAGALGLSACGSDTATSASPSGAASAGASAAAAVPSWSLPAS